MATISTRLEKKRRKLQEIDVKISEIQSRRDALAAEIKELEVTAIQQKMTEYNIPFQQIDLFLDSLNPKNTRDPNQINLFESDASNNAPADEKSADKGDDSK